MEVADLEELGDLAVHLVSDAPQLRVHVSRAGVGVLGLVHPVRAEESFFFFGSFSFAFNFGFGSRVKQQTVHGGLEFFGLGLGLGHAVAEDLLLDFAEHDAQVCGGFSAQSDSPQDTPHDHY